MAKRLTPWPYRGARLSTGWAPEEPEDELHTLAIGLFKETLEKVFNLHKKRHKERQNAIKEREK